jgi:hypothetical protein
MHLGRPSCRVRSATRTEIRNPLKAYGDAVASAAAGGLVPPESQACCELGYRARVRFVTVLGSLVDTHWSESELFRSDVNHFRTILQPVSDVDHSFAYQCSDAFW